MARITKLISYRRVSTGDQGESGLGLEAQADAIAKYVKATGGKVIAEFVDVASGADRTRQGFTQARELARRTGATIVVSKQCRLNRDDFATAKLMDDGIDFVSCDMPNADRFSVKIVSMFAEQYREEIRKHTTAALRALLARGVLLGSRRPGHWDGREDQREAGRQKATEKAAELRRELSAPVYAEVRAVVASMPHATLRAVADELDRRGILTPRGSSWTPTGVRRAILATTA